MLCNKISLILKGGKNRKEKEKTKICRDAKQDRFVFGEENFNPCRIVPHKLLKDEENR